MLPLQALQEPQWINCDVRNFDWSILGKFGVIMTDPPWHIRQVCMSCGISWGVTALPQYLSTAGPLLALLVIR